MSEAIISGIALVLTVGSGWAVLVIVRSILNACDDIAAIKKEICDEYENTSGWMGGPRR